MARWRCCRSWYSDSSPLPSFRKAWSHCRRRSGRQSLVCRSSSSGQLIFLVTRRDREWQALQALALERFHLLGLGVGLVIVAEQMQQAVDDEMGDMVLERLVFQSRFLATVSAASTMSPSIGGSGPPFGNGKAGKDRTLVGLSLPRQPALRVRIWASSEKTMLSSERPAAPVSAKAADTARSTSASAPPHRASRPPRRNIDVDGNRKIPAARFYVFRHEPASSHQLSVPRPRASLASRS